jgi:molybdopterin molybdotransferase
VAGVFGQAGLALDFYTIAMRPGKPLMAGKLDCKVMLGLPGNPVSAMVCGEIFLRPAIDAALGLPAGPRETCPAFLSQDQDSSLLATLARANALAIRPPHAPAAKAGSAIFYIPLD